MTLGALFACFMLAQGIVLVALWRLPRTGTRRRVALALSGLTLVAGLAALGMGALLENRLEFTDTARSLWRHFRVGQTGSATNDPGAIGALLAQQPLIRKPVSNERSAWTGWQAQVREALQQRMLERVDKPGAVVSREDSRRHVEGIEEVSLRLLSWKGAEIPAVMFVPKSAGRAPAVVVIPGHVKAGQSGLDEMAGRGSSYQNGAARELARAGFVTLAIELRGFGRLGPPRFPEHELVAYNAILAGTFYKALIITDIKAAVDFLVGRSEVDATRLGITGASLGGELAVTYAALDSRIRAVVFHSYGGSTGNFRELASPPNMKPHYCWVMPGSNSLFEQEDIFLLLAPRPTLGVRGSSEPFSNYDFRSSLERVWAALGAEKHLRLATAPGSHDFFVAPAVEFFREHLRFAP